MMNTAKQYSVYVLMFFFFSCKSFSDHYRSFDRVETLDMDKLLAQAQTENKDIVLYFSGFACVNCRYFEADLDEEEALMRRLEDDYIFLQLMVDDRSMAIEKKVSKISNRILTRKGEIFSDLQIQLSGTGTQPYVVVMKADEALEYQIDPWANNSAFVDYFMQ